MVHQLVLHQLFQDSKNSTKNEQSYSEAGFELGILGKAVHSPFGALKTKFLDRVTGKKLSKEEQEYLPQVLPITPGIINPLRISKNYVKGRYINLKEPSKKLVEFHGATSKLP
jgi:hypothetical protein